jgi:hypothetical protein
MKRMRHFWTGALKFEFRRQYQIAGVRIWNFRRQYQVTAGHNIKMIIIIIMVNISGTVIINTPSS